jgi:hypothetical protein
LARASTVALRLERLEPGLYKAENGLWIRRVPTGNRDWFITRPHDTRPVMIAGVLEFGSLTHAASLLNETRDRIIQLRRRL